MKSKKWAYFWWATTGTLGGHRFYLGCYGSGLILLAITVFTCGLGAIAGLYDIVNIPRIVERENKDEILRLTKEAKRK